jgi:hypothetical protein
VLRYGTSRVLTPGEHPEDRPAVAVGGWSRRPPLTAQHNCIATDVDRREPGLDELNVGVGAVALSDFVPLLTVAVPSLTFAVVRLIKHFFDYRKRVLDYYVQCYVVATDGSEGLLDLAELECARQRKRRRLKFFKRKGKERGSLPSRCPRTRSTIEPPNIAAQ